MVDDFFLLPLGKSYLFQILFFFKLLESGGVFLLFSYFDFNFESDDFIETHTLEPPPPMLLVFQLCKYKIQEAV